MWQGSCIDVSIQTLLLTLLSRHHSHGSAMTMQCIYGVWHTGTDGNLCFVREKSFFLLRKFLACTQVIIILSSRQMIICNQKIWPSYNRIFVYDYINTIVSCNKFIGWPN